jgi:hypothetical protein
MKYSFSIKWNIHMYCHMLICTVGERQYEAICESGGTRANTILIWLDDLGLPLDEKEAMLHDFVEWAGTQDFEYILYEGPRC